jgi:pyruvate dehydrogenase E1 component beta subunit
MPALSPSMTDGSIARWLVSEGQNVAAGDILAEIVTATATLELEAANEGLVEKILVPAGTAGVKINTPIAVIRAADAPTRPATAAAVPRRTPASRPQPARGSEPASAAITYREALRDALAEEMRRDADVFVIGVDIAQNRGARKVTQGLLDEFGSARVVTAPAFEETFTAMAIGAALSGLKPVVELASWSGALEAIRPVFTAAAETFYLSGGTVPVPIVIRGPDGWSATGPGGQSRSCAAMLAHVPGLKVVAPATPADAKALLRAAIRDPGPVLVLEHESLYETAGPLPNSASEHEVLGRAQIVRPGRDVTITAFGHALLAAIDAAEILADKGVSAEVLDLRSLRPLDVAAVRASVARTRRLVTVEEGWPRFGIGAEVCACVAETLACDLAAPPQRVTGADLPVPYAPNLAELAIPRADRIAAAALTAFRGLKGV